MPMAMCCVENDIAVVAGCGGVDAVDAGVVVDAD